MKAALAAVASLTICATIFATALFRTTSPTTASTAPDVGFNCTFNVTKSTDGGPATNMLTRDVHWIMRFSHDLTYWQVIWSDPPQDATKPAVMTPMRATPDSYILREASDEINANGTHSTPTPMRFDRKTGEYHLVLTVSLQGHSMRTETKGHCEPVAFPN